MQRYNPKVIEPKWQEIWAKSGLYKTDLTRTADKFYVIPMLPYPSGDLHVGHWYNFGPTDTVSRFHRMLGQNVFTTIGFDAFGLPAENAAIQRGIQPAKWTHSNIETMTKQIKQIGASYDWDHTLVTCQPDYYHWNQWLFLQLYKNGLAYRAKAVVNWCPKDQTVLANEQVVGENNVCERCGTPVIQKEMESWYFKITDYTESLLSDLEKVDWPQKVKLMQANWIGKSQGALIDFQLPTADSFVLLHGFTGSSKDNFFPWLKKEIEQAGGKAYVPDMPGSSKPDAKEQAKYVLGQTEFDENTVLLGHSYGSVTALRIVEQLKKPIKRLVLLAGFAQPGFIDHERNFEKTTDWNFDFEKIKKNTQEVLILRPRNDYAVPSERADFLQEKLGGQIVDFEANEPHATGKQEPELLTSLGLAIRVFTTRPDTIFGATYMVLAPEHPLSEKLAGGEQRGRIIQYIERSKRKTELERKEAEKEKTGVFTGSCAINPATKEKIPVWIADYVLPGYGTGAIMAVPAHDERDYEFAKKFDLPVSPVVAEVFAETDSPAREGVAMVDRVAVQSIVIAPDGSYLLLERKGWQDSQQLSFVTGGVDGGESVLEAAARELEEETGYHDIAGSELMDFVYQPIFYHEVKKENRRAIMHTAIIKLASLDQKKVSAEEKELNAPIWVSAQEVLKMVFGEGCKKAFRIHQGESSQFSGEGVLIHSGKYSGMPTNEAREKIVADLTKQQIAREQTNYRLRDWLISRQRYWGTPIPIIYCGQCGTVPVPEKDLPVILPEDVEFTPAGRNPLLDRPDFLNTKCPKCGGAAKRETDTMDTFVDSSWYFLRYLDNKNGKELFSREVINQWAPVDHYIGGIEHAILHLLYARFITKFLRDNHGLSFDEPFKKLTNQGIILGPDGQKMSKSRGNVVSPDEQVASYGADSLRLYLMFMGPYDQGGPYSLGGIAGTRRFLERIWTLVEEYLEAKPKETSTEGLAETRIIAAGHKAIKKVTKDLESLSFNTAIAAQMSYVNELYKIKADEGFSRGWQFAIETLLVLLAPFAPHISEELWAELGQESSIHLSPWPTWDEKLVAEEIITLAVQVNGKVRAEIAVPADISEAEAIKAAKAAEKIIDHIKGKQIKKTIYIPGRLVSLVV